MEVKEIESAIEGILFAAGEPVGVERLCLALDLDRATVDAVCKRLADYYSYERRGIRLVRMDASYQLCSAPQFAPYIRKAFESRRPAKLSQPALEVLAIIAYHQTATRAYVDQVRGVDSAYTISLLLERDLIEERPPGGARPAHPVPHHPDLPAVLWPVQPGRTAGAAQYATGGWAADHSSDADGYGAAPGSGSRGGPGADHRRRNRGGGPGAGPV